MANEKETQDQDAGKTSGPEATTEPTDERPGYKRIETGSTKHPDAKHAEDEKVTAVIGVYTGDNLQEAVERYGEDFVYDNFIRSIVVAAQSKVRRELDKGVAVAKIEEEFDDLDPTEKASPIQDPMAQAMRALDKMPADQRAKIRALLESDES